MADFSFTFSYDRDGHVAWLALGGDLDAPAAGRLRRVMRAAIGGLAPRRLFVDARDLVHHEGAPIQDLFRTGTERPDCDILLVTGPDRQTGVKVAS